MTHEELRKMREQRVKRLAEIRQSNDDSRKRVTSPLANQQGFRLLK